MGFNDDASAVKRGEVELTDFQRVPTKRGHQETTTDLSDHNSDSQNGGDLSNVDGFGSAAPDQRDMHRMGKQQEMRVCTVPDSKNDT